MSKVDKLIKRIQDDRDVSYEEAESLLIRLGFELEISGSHHIFRKKGYIKNVSLKRRPQLLTYQLEMLQEVLKDHDY